MHKLILLAVFLSVSSYQSISQTLDVGYLNPKLGLSHPDFKYIRFGRPTEYYGGLLWNNGDPNYGDGDDFTIFTYDNRDIVLQAFQGSIVMFPNFTPGKVGIGTSNPSTKLEVRGSIALEKGDSPSIFTGTGNEELNRYLKLLNSTGKPSASGLKAGGIL